MKDIKNFYRPTVFWSWNNKIVAEEIESQLQAFSSVGIGGIFVHARNVSIPYLGEEWFVCFDKVVECAEKYGIDVWIYDENGWPSGFGGGAVNGLGEEYCMKRLRRLEKGDPNILCEHDGMFFGTVVERNYVDLLNPAVTEAFIRSTHEKYKERYGHLFGSVIKGVFTDEPQLDNGGYPYGFGFDIFFEKECGYPLREDLWKLFTPSLQYPEFKADYFRCIGKRMRECFTEKIDRWCRENGLLFTGHFPCEDELCPQPSVTGGVMSHYVHMGQPGVDCLGRGYPAVQLLKQLSSVKNICRKPFVLTESFAGVGNGVRMNDFLRLYAYEAALGVNFLCMHLAAYSISGAGKRDYPPAISYQQPWWKDFGCFTSEAERINRFISEGESKNDVLVISPLQSAAVCAMYSQEQMNCSSNYGKTLEYLAECGIGFDIYDSAFYKDLRVENGKIILNGRIYSVVVLPQCISLESATYEFLREFSKEGTLIFVGESPRLVDGKPMNFDLRSRYTANSFDWLYATFADIGYQRCAECISPLGNGVRDVFMNIVHTNTGYNVLLLNRSETDEKRFSIRFDGKGRVTEEFSGDLKDAIRSVPTTRGGREVEIVLEAGEYKTLRFERGSENESRGLRPASVSYVPFVEGKRTEENFLVVDKAFIDVDGFSRKRLIEDIRRDTEGREKFILRYEFFTEKTEGIFAVIEAGNNKIFENGVELCDPIGWKIDRLLPVYELKHLEKGKNIIEIRFDRSKKDERCEEREKKFETVKNSVKLDFEAENLLLFGDFGVASDNGSVEGRDGYYAVISEETEYPFYITDHAYDEGYFYGGETVYETEIESVAGEKLAVKTEGLTAALATVFLDEERIGIIYRAPFEIELPPIAGKHRLKIVAAGSLRNIFGPFHGYGFENKFVARDSFWGVKSWDAYGGEREGKKISDYAFLKLKVDGIWIKRYRKA